ncbi:hypothetical protein H6F74_02450 [Trichocoleus sp. FACHB-90]|uniref:hypothetical protein n=1 Tax=Cyanophyceae TaxID=3028117 RepID=UPI0016870A18|nr:MULTISPECIES: hypothetical protein [unclassified Trichocoleus]MBD1835074.1 hypothetical protein [Cyanobacteria bacterium FACHB-472]MBD1925148.1 hypothetical protein [Trichocoleus sp. FACHB-90]MBD1934067.1 hypothetical protein [Trichocoleus sp. FACHB-69]MBD2005933.1 hypothetical protein [Trichocoleus sp. FACHB-40]
MKLSQYPALIAQAAQTVNEIDSQLTAAQMVVNRMEASADKSVAFEPDLKNDNQRKGRRFELLMVNLEYQHALNTVMRLTAERANAVAHLEYLRNQFSVAKLETRMAIARQLAGSEALELVGV